LILINHKPRRLAIRASSHPAAQPAGRDRDTIVGLTGRLHLLGQRFARAIKGFKRKMSAFFLDLSALRGRRISFRALAAVALLALAPLLAASPAHAQGAVRGKHGVWETRCETPPGASSEQCAIVQSVVDEDRPNITLVIIILKTADRKSRLLRVIAPLGVLLPSGLGLHIDKDDFGHMSYVRCLPTGCVAEVFLDDKLLARLGSAEKSTFVIFETPEEGVGVPVPLTGFKEAYEALP